VNTLLNLTVVPKNVQDKRVAKVRKWAKGRPSRYMQLRLYKNTSSLYVQ
jgi:hypothetical protein